MAKRIALRILKPEAAPENILLNEQAMGGVLRVEAGEQFVLLGEDAASAKMVRVGDNVEIQVDGETVYTLQGYFTALPDASLDAIRVFTDASDAEAATYVAPTAATFTGGVEGQAAPVPLIEALGYQTPTGLGGPGITKFWGTDGDILVHDPLFSLTTPLPLMESEAPPDTLAAIIPPPPPTPPVTPTVTPGTPGAPLVVTLTVNAAPIFVVVETGEEGGVLTQVPTTEYTFNLYESPYVFGYGEQEPSSLFSTSSLYGYDFSFDPHLGWVGVADADGPEPLRVSFTDPGSLGQVWFGSGGEAWTPTNEFGGYFFMAPTPTFHLFDVFRDASTHYDWEAFNPSTYTDFHGWIYQAEVVDGFGATGNADVAFVVEELNENPFYTGVSFDSPPANEPGEGGGDEGPILYSTLVVAEEAGPQYWETFHYDADFNPVVQTGGENFDFDPNQGEFDIHIMYSGHLVDSPFPSPEFMVLPSFYGFYKALTPEGFSADFSYDDFDSYNGAQNANDYHNAQFGYSSLWLGTQNEGTWDGDEFISGGYTLPTEITDLSQYFTLVNPENGSSFSLEATEALANLFANNETPHEALSGWFYVDLHDHDSLHLVDPARDPYGNASDLTDSVYIYINFQEANNQPEFQEVSQEYTTHEDGCHCWENPENYLTVEYAVGGVADDSYVYQFDVYEYTNFDGYDEANFFGLNYLDYMNDAYGTQPYQFLIAATDADGDALTYSITGGDDASLFHIETSGGNTYLVFDDPTAIDYENGFPSDHIYNLDIQVVDNYGGMDTAQVEIELQNINEAPNFTNSGDVEIGGSAQFDPEDTLYTFAATDPDTLSPGGEGDLTYHFWADPSLWPWQPGGVENVSDDGNFAINAETGEVTAIDDFHWSHNDWGNYSYFNGEYMVVVSDNYETANADPDTFETLYDVTELEVNMLNWDPEFGENVTNYNKDKVDLDILETTNQTDGYRFNGTNLVHLTGQYGIQAPTVTIDGEDYYGWAFAVGDQDNAWDDLTFTLTGDGSDENWFYLDSTSTEGTVYLLFDETGSTSIGNVDYEGSPSDHEFDLTITVTDVAGGSDTLDVDIDVLNVNEAPVLTNDPQEYGMVHAINNNVQVGNFNSTDPDNPSWADGAENDHRYGFWYNDGTGYKLENVSDDGLFKIDSTTGVVKTNENVTITDLIEAGAHNYGEGNDGVTLVITDHGNWTEYALTYDVAVADQYGGPNFETLYDQGDLEVTLKNWNPEFGENVYIYNDDNAYYDVLETTNQNSGYKMEGGVLVPLSGEYGPLGEDEGAAPTVTIGGEDYYGWAFAVGDQDDSWSDLSFTLTGAGSDENWFHLDYTSSPGTVYLLFDESGPTNVNDINYDWPASPDDLEFDLTLTVTDAAGATDTLDVDIDIMNVNEAPQFTNDPQNYGAVHAINNNTQVANFNSSDPDNPDWAEGAEYDHRYGFWYNDGTGYKLETVSDDGLFEIDGSTGRVYANENVTITDLIEAGAHNYGEGNDGVSLTVTDHGTWTEYSLTYDVVVSDQYASEHFGPDYFETLYDLGALNVTLVNHDPTISVKHDYPMYEYVGPDFDANAGNGLNPYPGVWGEGDGQQPYDPNGATSGNNVFLGQVMVGDSDGDSLTVTTDDTHFFLTNAGGGVYNVYSDNFYDFETGTNENGYALPDHITITVDDGLATADVDFALDLQNVNEAPSFDNGPLTADLNEILDGGQDGPQLFVAEVVQPEGILIADFDAGDPDPGDSSHLQYYFVYNNADAGWSEGAFTAWDGTMATDGTDDLRPGLHSYSQDGLLYIDPTTGEVFLVGDAPTSEGGGSETFNVDFSGAPAFSSGNDHSFDYGDFTISAWHQHSPGGGYDADDLVYSTYNPSDPSAAGAGIGVEGKGSTASADEIDGSYTDPNHESLLIEFEQGVTLNSLTFDNFFGAGPEHAYVLINEGEDNEQTLEVTANSSTGDYTFAVTYDGLVESVRLYADPGSTGGGDVKSDFLLHGMSYTVGGEAESITYEIAVLDLTDADSITDGYDYNLVYDNLWDTTTLEMILLDNSTPEIDDQADSLYETQSLFAALPAGEGADWNFQVAASDDDGDALTYSFVNGGDEGYFDITTDGVITWDTEALRNFEAFGDHDFEVTVQVADGNGGVADAEITITMDNVNEAPVFASDTYTADEIGAGGHLATVHADDVDAGNTVHYFFVNNQYTTWSETAFSTDNGMADRPGTSSTAGPNGMLHINELTGEITVDTSSLVDGHLVAHTEAEHVEFTSAPAGFSSGNQHSVDLGDFTLTAWKGSSSEELTYSSSDDGYGVDTNSSDQDHIEKSEYITVTFDQAVEIEEISLTSFKSGEKAYVVLHYEGGGTETTTTYNGSDADGGYRVLDLSSVADHSVISLDIVGGDATTTDFYLHDIGYEVTTYTEFDFDTLEGDYTVAALDMVDSSTTIPDAVFDNLWDITTVSVDMPDTEIIVGSYLDGWVVNELGDVNGDSINDFVVGNPWDTNQDEGSVRVLFGDDTFWSTHDYVTDGEITGGQGVIVNAPNQASGNDNYGVFGWSVAGMENGSDGDAPGEQVLGGAPLTNQPATDSGVVLALNEGIVDTAGTISESGGYGNAVNATLFKFPNGASVDAGTTNAAAAHLGWAVSSAGDFNNDGFTDYLVSAPDAHYYWNKVGGEYLSENNGGLVYLVLGDDDGAPGGYDLTLTSDKAIVIYDSSADHGTLMSDSNYDLHLGSSLAALGDINNDGYDDVIIGASGDNAVGAETGAVHIVYGYDADGGDQIDVNDDGDSAQVFTIYGEDNYDHFGASVANAGDINGDGVTDILVGATGDDTAGTDAGAAYLLFGDNFNSTAHLNATDALDPYTVHDNDESLHDVASLLDTSEDGGIKITGEAAGDNFGFSVDTAGDVNTDGAIDLIVGAPGNNGEAGSDTGAAYIIFNGTSADDATDPGVQLDDVLTSGSNTINVNNLDVVTLEGDEAGDRAGASVSTAGDVNDDGAADVLVGESHADPSDPDPAGPGCNQVDEGVTTVVLGAADLGAQADPTPDATVILNNPTN